MDELSKLYKITGFDKNFTNLIRKIQGSKRCPKFIYRYSIKKYGINDNLSRYWFHKYLNIPVGKYTWGHNYLESQLIKSIGAFCSIANNQNLAPNGHIMEYVTTWNTRVKYPKEFTDKINHSIIIGNDVWIGTNATLFNNIKIGDGAVIGTGAIIKEDVPPYAVVVGLGKIIKYRFPQEIIDKLLQIQWWNWDDEKIFESSKLFSDPISFIDKYHI